MKLGKSNSYYSQRFKISEVQCEALCKNTLLSLLYILGLREPILSGAAPCDAESPPSSS